MSLVPRYCPRCGGPAGHLLCPSRSELPELDESLLRAAALDIAARDTRIAELEAALVAADAKILALRNALTPIAGQAIEEGATELPEIYVREARAVLAATRPAAKKDGAGS